jgi:hypothetical protein
MHIYFLLFYSHKQVNLATILHTSAACTKLSKALVGEYSTPEGDYRADLFADLHKLLLR